MSKKIEDVQKDIETTFNILFLTPLTSTQSRYEDIKIQCVKHGTKATLSRRTVMERRSINEKALRKQTHFCNQCQYEYNFRCIESEVSEEVRSTFEIVSIDNLSTIHCVCKDCKSTFKTSLSKLRVERNVTHACPHCATKEGQENMKRTQRSEEFRARHRKKFFIDADEFISRCKELLPEYDYSKTVYNGMKQDITVICSEHGEFEVNAYAFSKGYSGCPKCSHRVSKPEQEIIDYVRDLVPEMKVETSISIFDDSREEVDIYVDDLKFAIEFNGTYFHCDKFRDKKYHYSKTQKCLKKNIELFHIWQIDWETKKDVVKSMIAHKLGRSKFKYNGRDCSIVQVNSKYAYQFHNNNHIQGGRYNTQVNFALKHKSGDILAVMSFTKNKTGVELVRFSSKLGVSVRGGFSKLLKHSVRYFRTTEIFTYVDLTYSNGDVYEKYFTKVSDVSISYFYVFNNRKYHKNSFKKDLLLKRYSEILTKDMTEYEMTDVIGAFRLWDAGKYKLMLKSEYVKDVLNGLM